MILIQNSFGTVSFDTGAKGITKFCEFILGFGTVSFDTGTKVA